VRDGTDPLPLLVLALAEDPGPSVRVAAARGLGDLGREEAVKPLLKSSGSHDVYLSRACGEALAKLGRIEGLDLLINSLTFPSIDAFYNYDRNVPNTLAALTGHDFPEKERYEQAKWRAWLEENRASIDLEENASAHRDFGALKKSLRGLEPEAAIRKYEEYLKEHPSYLQARKGAARLLNQVAWGMVTSAEGTPGYKPQLGLKYAGRCVELDPHPNYVDTLAEALLVTGKVDESEKLCREMLKKHPGERMFLDRLKRIEKLRRGGR
jgi:hypothetical protein